MNPSTDGPREERPQTRRARAWGALVDANPVLAKELLVTVRTPVFLGSIVVAPFLLGMLVLIVRLGVNRRFEPDAGRELFPVYFGGLTMALGTLGAVLASTVIVQEREAGALDALKFSSLGPRRIVFGKFAAVMMAEGAVAVCTLPLLAFVLDLGGVSIGETVVALAIALACGVMTASTGLAVSAHVANTRRSLLVSLMCASGIGIGLVAWLAMGSSLARSYSEFGIARGYFDAPFDGAYLALLCVIPAYALTVIPWFGYAAATSGLMDRSEDRGYPIKRWTLGALALGALALSVCASVASHRDRGAIAGASMIATALLGTSLLFAFVDEPIRPTRRMQVQPRALIVRLLTPRCLAPSVFFVVVASGIALVSVPVIVSASPGLEFDALWAIACLATLGGIMGTVAARRGEKRARAVGASILIGLTLLVVLLHDDSRAPSVVDAICPLWLEPGEVTGAQSMFLGSLAVWATAAFVSLAVMVRAVRTPAVRP